MANSFTNPTEIAREALRCLAADRLHPTPDNFRTLYHRIAGTAAEDAFPARSLAAIVAEMPRNSPDALRTVRQFEDAVERGQWPALRQALIELSRHATEPQPSWGPLLRDLVDGLDPNAANPSIDVRRADLHKILAGTHIDGKVLFARLRGLVSEWRKIAGSPNEAPASGSTDIYTVGALGPLIAAFIRRGVRPLIVENLAITSDLEALAERFEAPFNEETVSELGIRIERLSRKLEWLGDDQGAVRKALLGLLHLLVENIADLVVDDSWLHGQIALVSQCFAGPLDIRVLDEVERRLRDVIAKQARLKRHLSDAQTRLKTMLAGFLERLTTITSTTSSYHAILGRCAKEISTAKNIDDLSSVVEVMLRETQSVQEATAQAGSDLESLQRQVEEADHRIANLQRELDETSELVRHDSLTGTLNRKGIDEALAREASRCRRREEPLCLALLDIDGFKQVNDTYGHKVGDAALQHLAQVVRECLRPQDIVGRYGGEEFLIILPEAHAEDAAAILTRLQRQLTKRYFLADNQRLLITFSAGIAEVAVGEELPIAVDRADRAMYAAKRAGKNRVLVSA